MEWWPNDAPDRPEPLSLEVEDTPNPVVAHLLGPDGHPLVLVYERPRLPLGYHPGAREPSRTERL